MLRSFSPANGEPSWQMNSLASASYHARQHVEISNCDTDDYDHEAPAYDDAAGTDAIEYSDGVRPVPTSGEVTHERWTRAPRPRGRQAKDPQAEYVRFDCKDVGDMEKYLTQYIQAPTASAEHAHIEFHFPVTSAFMVYTRHYKREQNNKWTGAGIEDILRRTAVSVAEVLRTTEDAKEQVIRQKAVARIIVESIQNADGYRYAFQNHWVSREDKANRFSYSCNDSMMNKSRAANNISGVGERAGRPMKKPVYDCKGIIAIKFSVTKNNLEVHYRHVPLHKTYQERAPPPRKGGKRYRMMELVDPEAVKQIRQTSRKKATNKSDVPKKSDMQPQMPRRLRKTARALPVADGAATTSTDDVLQPLIEFLGSAERQAPLSTGIQPITIDGDDTNGNNDETDDGLIGGDDEISDAEPSNQDQNTASRVSLADKTAKRVNGARPAKRLRRTGETTEAFQDVAAMGEIQNSVDTGCLTWTTAMTPTAEPNNQGRKRASKRTTAESVQNKSQNGSNKDSLSEIELLKKQLAATQERLEKLEANRTNQYVYPPYSYSPYGHPPFNHHTYPYPPYPYPPYPQLPYNQPPPDSFSVLSQAHTTYRTPPAIMTNETQAGLRLEHRTSSNADVPLLYPGGPPHPNASQSSISQVPVTKHPVSIVNVPPKDPTARTTAPPAMPQPEAGIIPPQTLTLPFSKSTNSTGADQDTAQQVLSEDPVSAETDPSETHSVTKSLTIPARSSTTTHSHQVGTDRATTPPGTHDTLGNPRSQAPPIQPTAPATMTSRPVAGGLKLVDDDVAQRFAHNMSLQVQRNAAFAGPQQGFLRLEGPSIPGPKTLTFVSSPSTGRPTQHHDAAEEAILKHAFDSALAAITGPSLGLPYSPHPVPDPYYNTIGRHAITYPHPQNTPLSNKSTSVPISVMQIAPINHNNSSLAVPYIGPEDAYRRASTYTNPCPSPRPISTVLTSAKVNSKSLAQPAPQSEPKEKSPVGYDTLLAQMTAHAQTVIAADSSTTQAREPIDSLSTSSLTTDTTSTTTCALGTDSTI